MNNAIVLNIGTKEEQKEFTKLVTSSGLEIISQITANLRLVNAKTLINKGKVEELGNLVKETKTELIIINATLSPTQERNLSELVCARIVDRTGLILDIFAQRAQTHEAKLQIELAQLDHLSTRLKGVWTHLERQKGGIGLRGPGETQLETDRRLIGGRIKRIKQQLKKVSVSRIENRKSRTNKVKVVALAGYTNAGKSTLFNSLTKANIIAKDQLFATLDPTIRKLYIEDYGVVCIVDTVGFIDNLPHKLVKAFKATLEEINHADLILHVIDASSDERIKQINAVENVLEEIGAKNVPTAKVFNKIDLIEKDSYIDLKTNKVGISALDNKTLPLLKNLIKNNFEPE